MHVFASRHIIYVSLKSTAAFYNHFITSPNILFKFFDRKVLSIAIQEKIIFSIMKAVRWLGLLSFVVIFTSLLFVSGGRDKHSDLGRRHSTRTSSELPPSKNTKNTLHRTPTTIPEEDNKPNSTKLQRAKTVFQSVAPPQAKFVVGAAVT